jgi:hypothetical protein
MAVLLNDIGDFSGALAAIGIAAGGYFINSIRNETKELRQCIKDNKLEAWDSRNELQDNFKEDIEETRSNFKIDFDDLKKGIHEAEVRLGARLSDMAIGVIDVSNKQQNASLDMARNMFTREDAKNMQDAYFLALEKLEARIDLKLAGIVAQLKGS